MTDNARRRMRWAVRGALVLGVAASITANILHARDNPISQAISAWPPLALLITVELVSRIPLDRKGLGVVRLLATTAIAGIAAYISYWHMVGVVARYGETGAVPYLLPLSVDGLIVVASVSLVELAEQRQEPVDSAKAVTAMPAPAESTPPASPETTASAVPELAATTTGAPSITPPTAPATPPAIAAEPMRDDAKPAAEIPQLANPGPDEAATAAQPGELEPGSLPASVPESTGGDQDQDDQDQEDQEQDDQEQDYDPDDQDGEEDVDTGLDLAADLVPLLPAAREARDELVREGRTVSRDALARRLRRNGHAIRNNRVSELLNALRREQPHLNGARPTVSA